MNVVPTMFEHNQLVGAKLQSKKVTKHLVELLGSPCSLKAPAETLSHGDVTSAP